MEDINKILKGESTFSFLGGRRHTEQGQSGKAPARSNGKSGVSVWIDTAANTGGGLLRENIKSPVELAAQVMGIADYIEKAIENGAERARDRAGAVAVEEISRGYFLKGEDFEKNTRTKRYIYRGGRGNIEAAIEFSGVHIPLVKFDTVRDGRGFLYTRVKKQSAKTLLEHAFSARMGKSGEGRAKGGGSNRSGNDYTHLGVYERKYRSRFPIRQLWGPSAPQMLENNSELRNRVGMYMKKTFERHTDEEINRILSGNG